MSARVVVLPVLVAVAALAIWWSRPGPAGIPACTWRVGTGDGIRHAVAFDEVPPESPIRLSCWCDEPRWFYVFSHSVEDGTLLLWPSPQLASDLPQPLPGGAHVLPGSYQDRELAWTTRSGILAVTTFVVIASREPVAELEALAPRVRQWSNRVFTDRSMHVTKPSESDEVLGPARSTTFPAAVLQRAVERGRGNGQPNGPLAPDEVLPGVWSGLWMCKERKA